LDPATMVLAGLPTTMITRSQQSGLLIILFAFVAYVLFRVG